MFPTSSMTFLVLAASMLGSAVAAPVGATRTYGGLQRRNSIFARDPEPFLGFGSTPTPTLSVAPVATEGTGTGIFKGAALGGVIGALTPGLSAAQGAAAFGTVNGFLTHHEDSAKVSSASAAATASAVAVAASSQAAANPTSTHHGLFGRDLPAPTGVPTLERRVKSADTDGDNSGDDQSDAGSDSDSDPDAESTKSAKGGRHQLKKKTSYGHVVAENVKADVHNAGAHAADAKDAVTGAVKKTAHKVGHAAANTKVGKAAIRTHEEVAAGVNKARGGLSRSLSSASNKVAPKNGGGKGQEEDDSTGN